MNTVCFYMITACTPTFGGTVPHLASNDNLIVTLRVGGSNFFWLPIRCQRAGAPDDLSGVVVAGERAVIQPADAVELWFSLLFASYNVAMIVFLTEIMPAGVRTTGFISCP